MARSARYRIVLDLRVAFGRKLRALREGAGLSQEDLAERAELHWTFISGIERGRRNPGLNTLARLADALNMTVAALLDGVGERSTTVPARKRR